MKYMDMLAKLGVGSAHPGGFSATLGLLKNMSIAEGSKILEVGCGTGRTACYLAKRGYEVTAVDLRADMLDKALYRAKLEGVSVQFIEASIEKLPFLNNRFDLILAESVTIFADTQPSLAEYYRVLAPGGSLLDRELITIKPLKDELAKKISDFYGVKRVWSTSEWKRMLIAAGFKNIQLLQPGKFTDINWEEEMNVPDTGGVADPSIYFDERIWSLTRQYDDLMQEFGEHFGYGVWKGLKIK